MHTPFRQIYALCVELDGPIYEFTGLVFENHQDAVDYVENRKKELQAKIDDGAIENNLKLEALKRYEIVSGTIKLSDDASMFDGK